MLEGEGYDAHAVVDYLRYLRWNRDDKYLILKIAPDREDYSALTPAGLFGYIESQIPESRAMLFHQNIAVIVNLTAGATTSAAVLSALAYILREGLFKMGVSTELGSFLDIHDGFVQASIALEYGKKSSSMLWYYHFERYALRFLLDCARTKIHPRLLSSETLRKLRDYDAENNTELYHTLRSTSSWSATWSRPPRRSLSTAARSSTAWPESRRSSRWTWRTSPSASTWPSPTS